MSKTAYYIVATALEVLDGTPEGGLLSTELMSLDCIKHDLAQLRDRISKRLPSQDATVEVSLR